MGSQRARGAPLTEEEVQDAARRHHAGETIGNIARHVLHCHHSRLAKAFDDRGIPRKWGHKKIRATSALRDVAQQDIAEFEQQLREARERAERVRRSRIRQLQQEPASPMRDAALAMWEARE